MPEGGLILALAFESPTGEDARPEEIAAVLQDLDGLYRITPASTALGVPIVELLTEYYYARAETAAWDASDWPLRRARYERLTRSYQASEFEYFRERWETGRRAALTPPPHALRVSRLHMGSWPLDVLAQIPPDYWKAGGFTLFLAAVEHRFNMVGRIRTERAELKAKRAQARADEREAEVREAHAARELEGLRATDGPLQLVRGEVRPDDGELPEQ
jgi:hypothetical protein